MKQTKQSLDKISSSFDFEILIAEDGSTDGTDEILAFVDVDLSTDMRYVKELIEAIRSEGYDFAAGQDQEY